MKPWLNRLSTLLLLFSSSQIAAEPSLWLASKDQQQIYLFGSIHLGSDEFYPLPKPFIDAFEHSERLVIEMDVSAISSSDQQLLQRASQLPSGENLADKISPDYLEQLELRSQQLGISPAIFDNMQPWYVAVVLSQLQMQALGFEPELGLDLHFIQRAQQNQLAIHQLESFADQIEALSSLASIQVPLLEQTLDDFEQVPSLFNQLVDHWNNGENQKLLALLNDDPMFQHDAEYVLDKLLFERNRKWMQQLTGLSDTSFVVVGAMHLYGEQGLLDELKTLGYSIREVDPATN
ncbi:TraB/GumN family protein [Agarivorans aestuarii]|uniref:TraB/GumN family protein n=1 Tax=Agarivorans aestuarii TaxID=1563703 RepID=A0ABU7G782_9ALTE|nr:TraB/GumN family protein [Agarivorans aestuarii]MEE1674869.1 TraB/GumN family protein [Agarivorans aestuarii]